MNQRIRPAALLAARILAVASALGIATWLIARAQRGAGTTAPPAAEGGLHGSKSMVLDPALTSGSDPATTGAPAAAAVPEPPTFLFTSKSGRPVPPTTPPATGRDPYLPSSKVLRLAPEPPTSTTTPPAPAKK